MLVNEANLAGLFRSYNVIFNQGLAAIKPLWDQIAMLVPSTGEDEDYGWLMDIGGMREWLGDRVVKDLSGCHYNLRNKNFELTYGLDRNKIEDDKYGLFNPKITQLAQAAMRHRDALVFALLTGGFTGICADGQCFFDDDHPVGESTQSNTGAGSANNGWFVLDTSQALKPLVLQMRKQPELVSVTKSDSGPVFNAREFRYGVDDRKNAGYGLWQLAYGSKDTLTMAHLSAAFQAMMGFTNDDGEPLGIFSGTKPLVVVPPSLGPTALSLKNNDPIWATTATTNYLVGSFDLLISPWLT